MRSRRRFSCTSICDQAFSTRLRDETNPLKAEITNTTASTTRTRMMIRRTVMGFLRLVGAERSARPPGRRQHTAESPAPGSGVGGPEGDEALVAVEVQPGQAVHREVTSARLAGPAQLVGQVVITENAPEG